MGAGSGRITGGSRGLGLALAGELAREGCRLVLSARDAGELQRARQQVESLMAKPQRNCRFAADRAGEHATDDLNQR